MNDTSSRAARPVRLRQSAQEHYTQDIVAQGERRSYGTPAKRTVRQQDYIRNHLEVIIDTANKVGQMWLASDNLSALGLRMHGHCSRCGVTALDVVRATPVAHVPLKRFFKAPDKTR